ncbi:MAG: ankyrin repeat domain-containing protein [Pusillimonas sp.]
MRTLNIVYLVVLVAVFFAGSGLAGSQGELERNILVHGNTERTYFVHYPKNKPAESPKPLVFLLHGGGGGDAKKMAGHTRMNDIADREDFIVVYPVGIAGQWNDGRGKTFKRANNTDTDDVGFISSLIDLFIKNKLADSKRIYVMGLSNGGMMAHRLGIEIGNKLAAIAPVIANIPENLSKKKAPGGLSVLIMNGTEDPIVPWNGGNVQIFRKTYGKVLSTDQTVRFWVSAIGLSQTPKTEHLADTTKDNCTVEIDRYSTDGKPEEVVLYRIKGGGHSLPGGNIPNRPLLLGAKCMDIDAAETIWSFFKQQWTKKADFILKGQSEGVSKAAMERKEIDVLDRLGRSALHRAALDGNLEEAAALIAKGAKVDNLSSVGTPLYYAVDEGHFDVVKLLVENGANVNQPNGIGDLPLDTALYNYNMVYGTEQEAMYMKVILYLKMKGAKLSPKKTDN